MMRGQNITVFRIIPDPCPRILEAEVPPGSFTKWNRLVRLMPLRRLTREWNGHAMRIMSTPIDIEFYQYYRFSSVVARDAEMLAHQNERLEYWAQTPSTIARVES
jgi:hypothetical protein